MIPSVRGVEAKELRLSTFYGDSLVGRRAKHIEKASNVEFWTRAGE